MAQELLADGIAHGPSNGSATPTPESAINSRYGWVPFMALKRTCIHAPERLRDLVWAPVYLEFREGAESARARSRARHRVTVASANDIARLARRTDCSPLGEEQLAGGQCVLCTDAGGHDLLAIRCNELGASA